MKSKRRVVITSLGIVSSIGIGIEDFWNANINGVSGISRVDNFDTAHFGSKISGQIKQFKPELFIAEDIVKRTDRFVHLGLVSALLAFKDAPWLLEEDKHRTGVIFGSGLGGILFHEEQLLRGYEKGAHRLNPLCVPKITPNAVSSHVAINLKLGGPNFVVANACASGTNAVGEAFRKIQNGDADVMVAGGAEAPLTEFTFGAYDAMRVLSRRNEEPEKASRPFDRQRDGFVIAEGGAVLILEELESALKRNSRIYAEVIGYAANSGAYHMVMPDPSGADIAQVMRSVLSDACILPADIDYINAHGTSTVQNDRVETKAIKEVFGERARFIPVSSTKSALGHSIGASGAIEACVCALVLDRQIIPPTINCTDPDPECDLDYVTAGCRPGAYTTVLSNSFGFGSNNACLILRRYNG